MACNSETLAVGDRVVDVEHGAGIVLGFRKQNGDRIGDTSGGLSSNGCVRIKFDARGDWNTTNKLSFEKIDTEAPSAPSSSSIRPGIGDKVKIVGGDTRRMGEEGTVYVDASDHQPYKIEFTDGKSDHWFSEAEVVLLEKKKKGESKVVAILATLPVFVTFRILATFFMNTKKVRSSSFHIIFLSLSLRVCPFFDLIEGREHESCWDAGDARS